MIFKFVILSDEEEKFRREIKIDADATFLDFHQAIIDCTGFDPNEMTSFFICEDNWRKKTEITRVEMDTDSDQDSYTMEECVLSDFLEDEKQKLMFMFDILAERSLYVELSEIITGRRLDKAICDMARGVPPPLFLELDEPQRAEQTSANADETFYGDTDFTPDELDAAGYEGIDDFSGMNDTEAEEEAF